MTKDDIPGLVKLLLDTDGDDVLPKFIGFLVQDKSFSPEIVETTLKALKSDEMDGNERDELVINLAQGLAKTVISPESFVAYINALASEHYDGANNVWFTNLIGWGMVTFTTTAQQIEVIQAWISSNPDSAEGWVLDQLFERLPLPEGSTIWNFRKDLCEKCVYITQYNDDEFSIPSSFLKVIQHALEQELVSA